VQWFIPVRVGELHDVFLNSTAMRRGCSSAWAWIRRRSLRRRSAAGRADASRDSARWSSSPSRRSCTPCISDRRFATMRLGRFGRATRRSSCLRSRRIARSGGAVRRSRHRHACHAKISTPVKGCGTCSEGT
jgi:hypothetical protein